MAKFPRLASSSTFKSVSGSSTTVAHSQQCVFHSVGISESCANLVQFSLEEKRLLSDTKAFVDELLEFIFGHSVDINDLVRAGHAKLQSDPSPLVDPHPFFIKFSTILELTLVLASKHKPKDFDIK